MPVAQTLKKNYQSWKKEMFDFLQNVIKVKKQILKKNE